MIPEEHLKDDKLEKYIVKVVDLAEQFKEDIKDDGRVLHNIINNVCTGLKVEERRTVGMLAIDELNDKWNGANE